MGRLFVAVWATPSKPYTGSVHWRGSYNPHRSSQQPDVFESRMLCATRASQNVHGSCQLSKIACGCGSGCGAVDAASEQCSCHNGRRPGSREIACYGSRNEIVGNRRPHGAHGEHGRHGVHGGHGRHGGHGAARVGTGRHGAARSARCADTSPGSRMAVAIDVLKAALTALRVDRSDEYRYAFLDAERRGRAAHVRANPARRQEQQAPPVRSVACGVTPHERVERCFARAVDVVSPALVVRDAALSGRHDGDRPAWINEVAQRLDRAQGAQRIWSPSHEQSPR